MNNKSIGIIGGMGPQAGLFAHDLILKHARSVWGGEPRNIPYHSSLNITG